MELEGRGLPYGAATDPGLVRPNNEDAYRIIPERGLYAVADGMGGHQGGEVAAQLAVAALDTGHLDPDDPEPGLVAMLEAAHRRILETAGARPEVRGMGTTLTVAHVGPRYITVAHVGDSRAYLVKEGRAHQLTKDHSVIGALVDSGQIDPAEARHHPQRHLLTQAVGTQETLDVHVARAPRQDAQYLLLCTDGLVEVMSDEEMVSLIQQSAGVQEAVDRLMEAARTRGAPDNVTVILVDLRPADENSTG